MGGKCFTRSAIYQLFSKSFYFGRFEYPVGSGQWYDGKHEPMITEQEYDQVQLLLGRKGSPRSRSQLEFAFTGLIRCGVCNRMVTAEEKHQVKCSNCHCKFAYRTRNACPRCKTPIERMKTPSFRHYTYYHCSKSRHPHCPQKSVSALDLERQISRQLAVISIPQAFKDYCIQYLHELHSMESVSQAAIIAAQQKAYARCVQQLDNLVILLTAPDNADGSQLSKPEYTVRRATLLKEKLTLEELLRDTGKRVEQQLKLSEQTFEFACSAQERFANGDAMVKKEMIATFASNLTLTDKMLSVQAKKPYFILEQSLAATNFQTTPIEPGFVGPVQGSNGRVTSDRPYVLGGLDEDRTKRDRMLRISALVYAHFEAEFPRVCGKRDYGEAPGKL